ncbi:MAG: citrate lyase acyl carrier protein [Asgard group archaeon]|nr:citrate lyase acyl carrier protein [Asgard group archaeon]
MKIKQTAQAGSLESCDILITIEPVKTGSGIDIDLESPGEKPFGDKIRSEITETLHKYDIKDAKIIAVDKGALGYCIKARVETALKRASEK